MRSFDELIPAVKKIAEQAAEAILAVYDTDFSVKNKDDQTPLTEADMASHKSICAGLKALSPDIPILSEESADISYAVRSSWDEYWLIDPLDGTREFVKRNGEFTVNIALIKQQRPVLGVVHVPVTGVCYFAAEGLGAFKQDADNDAVEIRSKETNGTSFIVAGSRSHGSEQQQRFFTSLGENVEVIAIGSSLKLCLVAEGQVDIYPRFGPTSEWDTAAAHCVVEQAGGLVSDTSLQALKYNTKDSFLNPHFLAIADQNFDWQSRLKGIDN